MDFTWKVNRQQLLFCFTSDMHSPEMFFVICPSCLPALRIFKRASSRWKILYSFTVEDTAKLIRQIGEASRARSVVWNKLEWIKRKWLTNEASAVRL